MVLAGLAAFAAGSALAGNGFQPFAWENFMYVVKGLRIADGDWLPLRYNAMGWPVALGAMFRVLGIEGIRRAEAATLVLEALLVGGSLLLARAVLARRIGGARAVAFAAVGASLLLLYFPIYGLTESLTAVVLVAGAGALALGLSAAGRRRVAWLVVAGALLGSLAAVRPNGYVPLAAGVLAAALPSGSGDGAGSGARLRAALAVAGGGALLALPAAAHRWYYYGDPLDYGTSFLFFPAGWGEVPAWLAVVAREGALGQLEAFASARTAIFPFDARLAGALLAAVVGLSVLAPRAMREVLRDPLARFSAILVAANFAFLSVVWPAWPNFRYWTPYLFFLLALALLGWERIAQRARTREPWRRFVAAYAPLVVVLLVLVPVLEPRAPDLLASYRALPSTAERWVERGSEDAAGYAEPAYVDLARTLDACCRDALVLNAGAGGGSYPFGVLRHYADLTFLPDGTAFSPSRGMRVTFPDVTLRSLEEFVARYGDGGRTFVVIDPSSHDYRNVYTYLRDLDSSPRFREVARAPGDVVVYELASEVRDGG